MATVRARRDLISSLTTAPGSAKGAGAAAPSPHPPCPAWVRSSRQGQEWGASQPLFFRCCCCCGGNRKNPTAQAGACAEQNPWWLPKAQTWREGTWGGGGSFKEQPGLLLPTHLPAASMPLQVTLLPRDCCCSRCRRCNLFPLGGPSLQHTLPWSLQCGQGKRCGKDWRGLPHTHTHSLRPRQVGATTTGTSQGSAESDRARSPLLPISSTCSAPPIRPPRDQTG